MAADAPERERSVRRVAGYAAPVGALAGGAMLGIAAAVEVLSVRASHVGTLAAVGLALPAIGIVASMAAALASTPPGRPGTSDWALVRRTLGVCAASALAFVLGASACLWWVMSRGVFML